LDSSVAGVLPHESPGVAGWLSRLVTPYNFYYHFVRENDLGRPGNPSLPRAVFLSRAAGTFSPCSGAFSPRSRTFSPRAESSSPSAGYFSRLAGGVSQSVGSFSSRAGAPSRPVGRFSAGAELSAARAEPFYRHWSAARK
jgi:hypothetical protein